MARQDGMRRRELIFLHSASADGFTALAQPALARSYLNCSTRKVVMISAPSGDTSSTREEEVAFVIDVAAKKLTFSDNSPLTVTRLDKYWISANRDDIFLRVQSPRWHPDVRKLHNAR